MTAYFCENLNKRTSDGESLHILWAGNHPLAKNVTFVQAYQIVRHRIGPGDTYQEQGQGINTYASMLAYWKAHDKRVERDRLRFGV